MKESGSRRAAAGEHGSQHSFERDDAVMTLFESDVPVREIAHRMRLRPSTVASIIKYMRPGAQEARFSDKAIREQSAAFLTALRQHHPERCQG